MNLARHAHVPMLLVMTVMATGAAGAGQAPAAPPAPAGPPAPAALPAPRAPLPDMQRVAAALGVTCGYCHAGRGGSTDAAVTSTGKPRLAVAREMIDMTAALNASVQSATGKPANETVAVQCVTCHRGVAIPRPLTDIILMTALRQNHDAAVTQYRELRERYYGRGAYDFGEETILNAVRRLSAARPEAAISLAQLNLEFFPKSVNTLVALAIAQSRDNDEAAIATLKRALEIEPENGELKGRLFQLEEVVARRNRAGAPR
jgi:tetratricopeptide (TPR) repeat protein